MVCTNDVDFFNYLQNKGVKVVLNDTPVEINGVLNIMFPCTHNITICGNRYNNERIASGEMKKELENLKYLISCKNTIVVTPITLFNGKLHKRVYPESTMNVPRQRIHTSKLGELVYPHFVHIYGAKLTPTTDFEPLRDLIFYGDNKRQETLYFNVFWKKASKDERRKKRHIPEYALFSALYNQVIVKGDK